jgi:hypothetical protein
MLTVTATAAFLLTTVSPMGLTEKFERVGSYADVKSHTGEHCDGYSLDLWRADGRLIGRLDIHRGLCGDPPCGTIADAALDASGRLTFSTEIDGQRWTFTGTLTRDAVNGTLNGTRVRLRRDRERDKYWTDYKPDQSLDAWCEFWAAVKRCSGVRELCASLGRK